MIYSALTHSRNKLIILLFLSSVISHLTFSLLLNEFGGVVTSLTGIVYGLFLFYLLKYRNVPENLKFYILGGATAYILLLNMLEPNISYLIYLVLPIILSAIYNVVWLNLIVSVITGAEVVFLLVFFNSYYILTDESSILIHFCFMMFIVTIFFILYTLKIGPVWKKLFDENEKMGAQLTSKDGYLNHFFEYAEDAIVVFGPDQKIIAVNPAFEKMYGWKSEECIGQLPRLVPMSEDHIVSERSPRVIAGETFNLIQTKELRKDGSIFDAELTLAPIYDADKNIIATSFIARDITLRLQSEQSRINGEKVKAIGEVAAGVAHEVRNPLTSISGFIQMMNNDPDNPYRLYTNIIQSEINRIDLIVAEFLVLSKPSFKKSAAFVIEKALSDVLAMFEPELSKRNIFCKVHISNSPTVIVGNEDELKQVFINLLKNSYEALENNGIITVSVANSENSVAVIIHDNGSGMNCETLDNMYDPFFTTKPEGTGLGMMISKKIILDHGGELSVKSRKGIGTEVTITLPIVNEKKTAIH